MTTTCILCHLESELDALLAAHRRTPARHGGRRGPAAPAGTAAVVRRFRL